MSNLDRGNLATPHECSIPGGDDCDLTVICGLKEFKAHRSILCTSSNFFAAAFDGGFAEAKTATILLQEDDPPAVERMISYLYTLDYDDLYSYYPDTHSVSNIAKNNEPNGEVAADSVPNEPEIENYKLMNNILVYITADKYNILPLKILARSKFVVALTWPLHSLFAVTQAVYELISDDDVDFRKPLFKFWVVHSEEIEQMEEFVTIKRCPLLESPILEMCLEKKFCKFKMQKISEEMNELRTLMKIVDEEGLTSLMADNLRERESRVIRLEKISEEHRGLGRRRKWIFRAQKMKSSSWISWGNIC